MRLRPDLALVLVSKNFSSLLISFSLLSVLHIVQKNVTVEKISGLIDTLLTTPLTLQQLVWGKALQVGILGYAAGLAVSIINTVGFLLILKNFSIIQRIGWETWVFAFALVPLAIVGLLSLVITLVLVVDSRSVMMLFTTLVGGLLAVSSIYQQMSMQWCFMAVMALLGAAGYILTRVITSRATNEKVLMARV